MPYAIMTHELLQLRMKFYFLGAVVNFVNTSHSKCLQLTHVLIADRPNDLFLNYCHHCSCHVSNSIMGCSRRSCNPKFACCSCYQKVEMSGQMFQTNCSRLVIRALPLA